MNNQPFYVLSAENIEFIRRSIDEDIRSYEFLRTENTGVNFMVDIYRCDAPERVIVIGPEIARLYWSVEDYYLNPSPTMRPTVYFTYDPAGYPSPRGDTLPPVEPLPLYRYDVRLVRNVMQEFTITVEAPCQDAAFEVAAVIADDDDMDAEWILTNTGDALLVDVEESS